MKKNTSTSIGKFVIGAVCLSLTSLLFAQDVATPPPSTEVPATVTTEPTVTTSTNTTVSTPMPTPTTSVKKNTTVKTVSSATAAAAKKAVTQSALSQKAAPSKLTVKATLGFSSKSGNTESDAYTGRIEAEDSIGKTILYGLAEGNYAESQTVNDAGVTETSQTEANAKINADIKQRFNGFFIFGDAILFHDEPAGIDLRAITSSGVGTFLADSDKFKFSIETGLAYVIERTDANDDYVALRFAERIDYQLSDAVSAWERAEMTPEAQDFGNYLLSYELGIDSAISKTISFGLMMKVDYDSQPVDNTQKTDTVIGATVSFSI